MSKPKKSKPASADKTPKTDTKTKPCRAKDVGHHSCDCGGPQCGDNVTG